MAERIATIKLNSGQGGFFDELTNIHLTVASPIAYLYAGQNLTNIRKGISVGHLILTDGTLGPDPRPYRLVRVGNHLEITLKPEAMKKKAPKKVEVVLKEDPKKDAPAEVAEEKAEPVEEVKKEDAEAAKKEEVVEEKKATKRTSAKKTTKKDAKKVDAE